MHAGRSQNLGSKLSKKHPNPTFNRLSPMVMADAFIGLDDTPLGALLDLIPMPAILADRECKIRFMNKACSTIMQNAEDLVGQDVSVLFPSEADHLNIFDLLSGAHGCECQQMKVGEISLGPRMLSFRIYMSPLTLAGERLTLMIGENRSTKQKVRLMSESLISLLKVFPAAVARFEPDNPISIKEALSLRMANVMSCRLTDGNDRFAQSFGFDGLSELKGARLSELIEPDGPLDRTIHKWLELKIPLFQTTMEDARKTGRPVPEEIVLAPDTTGDRLNSFWLIKRELEEPAKHGGDLNEALSCFQTLFERTNELVLMKDIHLRYRKINPAAERFLNTDESSVLGKSTEDLWGKEHGPKIMLSDRRAINGKKSEHIVRIKQGKDRLVLHIAVCPIRDSEEAVIGVLEICSRVPEIPPALREREVAASLSARSPVCRSPAMQKLMEQVWLASRTEGLILITGETGTGKDFIAGLIHEYSQRSSGPFFSINCAAVPDQLAESELFGHEAGAFTGAGKRKKGLLELAQAGTLLMNEIGDLGPVCQPKLLSFFDTQSFLRVGGEKAISVDVRILAATNHDLEEDVKQGRFREDLFHRLNVLNIIVPPLRERMDDLPELIDVITDELSKRTGSMALPTLDPEIMEAFRQYHWPGNVRELRSVLERAMALPAHKKIDLAALGLPTSGNQWQVTADLTVGGSLHDVLEDVKRSMIEEALKRAYGKRQEAARLLGISRNSLKHHMRSLAGKTGDRKQSGGKSKADESTTSRPEASRVTAS